MLTYYKLADSAEVGKTGTITVPVTESTNYNHRHRDGQDRAHPDISQ